LPLASKHPHIALTLEATAQDELVTHVMGRLSHEAGLNLLDEQLGRYAADGVAACTYGVVTLTDIGRVAAKSIV
jgi:hypothetical protein